MSIAVAATVLVSLCVVCVSTNLSAGSDSSRASVQATPDLVGNPIAAGTGPSVCEFESSNGTHYLYLFVKGGDGALWYNRDDSTPGLPNWGWSGWTSLGGKLSSSPCAVSLEAGYLDVYVAGTTGTVYERSYFSGAWHDWYNVGGRVAPGTGPAASVWPGREDVFVQGTTGALYQKTWTQSGWSSSWTNLGGYLTSSPAAVSWGAGRIDVTVPRRR